MKKIEISRSVSNGSNYVESPGNVYGSTASPSLPPRHMGSNDQWTRDEPQRNYSFNSSQAAQDQRLSPPMVPSNIRGAMSTDLYSDPTSRYQSQDTINDNMHGAQTFSPPLPSGVRHSSSVNYYEEDDSRNTRLSPEGHRHGSMMASAPPVTGMDNWQGHAHSGGGGGGIAANQYNNAGANYNTSQQAWGQEQTATQSPYSNYGYQGSQKSYEDNA